MTYNAWRFRMEACPRGFHARGEKPAVPSFTLSRDTLRRGGLAS